MMRTLPILLVVLGACKNEDAGPQPRIPLADLGEDRVTDAPDLDPADTDAVWLAVDHAVAGMEWPLPQTGIPSELWAYLYRDPIADRGTCPAEVTDSGGSLWTAACTSSTGYDWTGTMEEARLAEEGVEGTLQTWDLEVVALEEGALFDRIALQGSVRRVDGDGDPVAEQVQVNLSLQVEGYWSHTTEPEHAAAWNDLRWTGWAEAEAEGDGWAWTVDMAQTLGGYGTARLTAEGVVAGDACDEEPEGRVTVEGAQTVTPQLKGCDRCFEYELDGALQQACPP